MSYKCSAVEFANIKECRKKASRFVVLEKKKKNLSIVYACEYHFAKFYGVDMERKHKKKKKKPKYPKK